MSAKNEIQHEGIVVKKTEDELAVSILAKSACASCQLKKSCSISDLKEKIIHVKTNTATYQKGEHVIIFFQQAEGYQALLLGYIYPFLALLITLIVSSQFTGEALAGILSVLILIPYYLSLYLFRKKITKKFQFSIRKN